MDYKGLRDRHLNVFCGYDSEHLENNITKAFINVIDSMSESNQAKIYSELVGFSINDNHLHSSFYLQQRPNNELIESIPIKNRFIIGISPTGKTWGFHSEDIQDEEKLKIEIAKEWKSENKGATDDEIKEVVIKVLEEIKNRRAHKGSVPDAWIFVSNDDTRYLIIIENKLFNLDPDQINNHIEKSLLQNNPKDKNKPIYHTFKQISDMILETQTYMAEQFVEYLTILGYLNVNSLPLACSSDVKIRARLATHAGMTIMKELFGENISRRDCLTVKKDLNKSSYLREINLCFRRCAIENGSVYISLALGPTMSSAKYMFNNVALPTSFSDKHISSPFASFHLQYNRGRNINNSYIDGWTWEINDYIDYWKKHISDLKLMSTGDAAIFIERLASDEKFPTDQAKDLSAYLKARKNPINIVPEIIYEISWTCDEISIMKDNAEFEQSLKCALSEFLDAINLSVQGIN